MPNIQIKRYNGSSWDMLYPKTLTSLVTNTNGTALVDSSGKINTTFLPDYILGQLVYGGTFGYVGNPTPSPQATLSHNAQSKLGTNASSISLINSNAAIDKDNIGNYTKNDGIYYIYQGNDGDKGGDSFFGITDWQPGDWLVATANGWGKIDNTDAVTSVAGRTGAITLTMADITDMPSWSKAATKPSYNFSELGSKPTTLSGYGITDAKISGGVITLGGNTITPLTSHQSLTNYSTKSNTIKALSINGRTITYTKGDDTTGTIITQDTTYSDATQTSAGLMSVNDKKKLDGIAASANNYTHPNFLESNFASGIYKLTLNESGHVTAATAVVKADITALGIPGQDTTYSDATTSAHGLMTASDVVTLNTMRSETEPTTSTTGDICFVTI